MDDADQSTSSKPSRKRGILYLSTVPSGMTVSQVQEQLEKFGEIGRIFLRPDPKSMKRKVRLYEEGWAEYLNYKQAKQTAKFMNCTTVPGKNKRWSGMLWNVRYLDDFAWEDINRVEREEQSSRLLQKQSDILAGKKAARQFKESLAQSRLEDRLKARRGDNFRERKEKNFRQKIPEEKRDASERQDKLKAVNNSQFMMSLLGGQ